MKNKGFILLVSLMVFAMSSLTGCRKYEQVRVVSGKVVSVSMTGFRSMDLLLSVEVDNPAGKIVVDEAEGILKHFGKVIGKVTLAPLTLRPRSVAEYEVKALVELDKSVGIKELMTFMDIRRLNECTADVFVKGAVAGVRGKKKFNDIPLKKLLENKSYEKI